MEEILALLLALEALSHGEGVIEWLVEGVHDLSDLAGLDNITGLLLAVVHLHVVPQVCLLAEAPVTDLALEGPGPCVHIHVALQIPRGGEGFGTQQALVWLLLENKMY